MNILVLTGLGLSVQKEMPILNINFKNYNIKYKMKISIRICDFFLFFKYIFLPLERVTERAQKQ